MSVQSTYIHGTDPIEQERLADLNVLTNPAFVKFLNVRPGSRVLDVGSGLSLLADAIAVAGKDIWVVALEHSPDQLRGAVRSANVRHVQGDAHELVFLDGSFDLVYARYLLEHVSDPTTILKEMRRVTRLGGRVVLCENDISLVRLDPPCPSFDGVWRAFQQYQANLGGDSHIGRLLYRLFVDAGFSKIELSVQPEVHWYGSPGFALWNSNLIGNVNSARKGLVSSGLCTVAVVDAAIEEITRFGQCDVASSVFVWNRATALR